MEVLDDQYGKIWKHWEKLIKITHITIIGFM
jgi:hypothetical protein